MKDLNPPKGLPPGFRDIWRALHQAAERAPSRQALARRLGISTHTLQRILVDGNVPDFAATDRTRVLRSWTRSLTRLAFHLGGDHRRWLESVGIAWSAETAAIANAALEAARMGRAAPAPTPLPAPDRSAWDLPNRIVRIGLVAHPDEFAGGFLESLAERLIRAVDVERPLHFEPIAASDPAAWLAHDGEPPALVVGLPETTVHRRRGIVQLPIPGWTSSLRLLTLRTPARGASLPSWSEVFASEAEGALFLTLPGEMGHQYLLGQRALAPSRLLVPGAATIKDLATLLQRESENHLYEQVYFIGGAGHCLALERALSKLEGRGAALRAHEIRDNTGQAPRYRLCIGIDASAPDRWRALLEHALHDELFGTYAVETAQLYARELAHCHRRGRAGHALEAFPEAGRRFIDALCDSLASQVDDRARRWLPREWQASFAARVTGVHRLPYCQSCAASLAEEHNQGISSRYCRFCSDAEGNLRARGDVEQILADWFQRWQLGLTPARARERAKLYMQTMPAWSDN